MTTSSATFRRNPSFMPAVRAEAAKRIHRGAQRVRDQAVALMSQSGPSAPGQPAANISGELSASMQTWGPVHQADAVIAAAGSDLPKARFLEGGTDEIQPRPTLQIALAISGDAVMREMGGGV